MKQVKTSIFVVFGLLFVLSTAAPYDAVTAYAADNLVPGTGMLTGKVTAPVNIGLAVRLGDLGIPLGNRLHKLGGNRKGQCAIAINDQWRICFRFVDGDAYDVEITDYH